MGLIYRVFHGNAAVAPEPEPELPSAAASMPPSTSAPTPLPTPSSISPSMPEPMPASEPASTYVIRDAAGVAVDLSHCSEDPQHPRMHAALFLRWLTRDDALAGWVLEKVLKRLYVTEFCPRLSLKPLPWLSVLREFNVVMKLTGGTETFKAYKPVYKGRRRRRLRAYCIPPGSGDTETPAA